MNVNLHIDSIVLDGIDLAPGQSQTLRHAIASELTNMLTQQGIGSSLGSFGYRASVRGGTFNVGRSTDVTTLGPQLASAIYAIMPRPALGLDVAQGGMP